MAVSQGAFSRKWILVLSGFFLAILAAGGFIAWRARHFDELAREWIVRELSRRFSSGVELRTIRLSAFPDFSVAGEDLSIPYRNRADLPPLIHVDTFRFRLGLVGMLRLPKHIPSLTVTNLTITIPPRNERIPRSSGEQRPTKSVSGVVVDEIRCVDANLIVLSKDSRKEPLDWTIHNLALRTVSLDKPFHFVGALTNAKPVGEIATEGDFGPWNLDDPGGTPVAGSFKFANANLNPFPGIMGTLSSTGTFRGPLDELEVQGQTDTPNFALDPVGKPVALHTEYSATVDGTDGDTFLHPVRATLVRSLILAHGKIVNVKGKGHDITLDVSAPAARIEDLLSLAMKSETPVMTGPAKIKARLYLPPGKVNVLQKLILDGQFGVDDAQWSSPEVREKLAALSRTAEGHPKEQDAGSAISDLRGGFHLEKGVIRFSQLSFSVPGAAIDLAGTYEIEGGAIDFKGHLRTQAKLSEMTTGVKSFFLKAFDPFFKKNGAGAELPITISGTRDRVKFGVSVFHKTVKGQVSPQKEQKKGQND